MDREGASSRPYVFPQFYQYAPYFTVQPVAETFSKQKELWSSLILSYCMCSNKTLLLPRTLAVDAPLSLRCRGRLAARRSMLTIMPTLPLQVRITRFISSTCLTIDSSSLETNPSSDILT